MVESEENDGGSGEAICCPVSDLPEPQIEVDDYVLSVLISQAPCFSHWSAEAAQCSGCLMAHSCMEARALKLRMEGQRLDLSPTTATPVQPISTNPLQNLSGTPRNPGLPLRSRWSRYTPGIKCAECNQVIEATLVAGEEQILHSRMPRGYYHLACLRNHLRNHHA